jgi:hypothetical protein
MTYPSPWTRTPLEYWCACGALNYCGETCWQCVPADEAEDDE